MRELACLVDKELVLLMVERGPKLLLLEAGGVRA